MHFTTAVSIGLLITLLAGCAGPSTPPTDAAAAPAAPAMPEATPAPGSAGEDLDGALPVQADAALLYDRNFGDFKVADWSTVTGTWQVLPKDPNLNQAYCAADPAESLTLTGSAAWTDYQVQAKLRLNGQQGSVGVLGRVQDAGNLYMLDAQLDSAGSSTWHLFRRQAGAWTVLSSGPLTPVASQDLYLRLGMQGDRLTAETSADARTWTALGNASDRSFMSGRIGLRTFESGACFDEVRAVQSGTAPVTPPGPPAADDRPLPPDAGVINVKTDFGAKGDGKTDDTAAIQAAIAQAFDASVSRYSAPRLVYFPKGTYRLSNTLENRVPSRSWSDGWRAGMVLVGESRSATILQLADKASGYGDPKAPKAVIRTGSENPNDSSGGGNQAFRHELLNLTIDTGRGNAGATGIDYVANNRGAIEDVTIRSGDGAGVAGLYLKRSWPGPALIKNVSIQGFDYGVTAGHYQYGLTFEHLNLSAQRVAGIDNWNNVLHIRDLQSNNRVPALQVTGGSSHVTLIDARLSGGGAGAAIVNKGKLYARNLVATGYSQLIDDQNSANRDVAGGTVTEYLSHSAKSLFDSPAQALNLPVEEAPDEHVSDLSQWTNVASFGAKPNDSKDDTSAIQAAIDLGKPVVYLPNGKYLISKPLNVRGSVRKIEGMEAQIAKTSDFSGDVVVRVQGSAPDSVILEHLDLAGVIENASGGSLTLRHLDHNGYRSAAGTAGKLFLEDVIGRPYLINGPQQVWGRQVNAEFDRSPLIENNGGTLWILGLKTEGRLSVIKTVGGQVELLGALIYPLGDVASDTPAFINDGGKMSLSYVINDQNYAVQVRERRGGIWRELTPEDVASRGNGSNVTLYTGY